MNDAAYFRVGGVPRISVVMANYRGAAHLPAALDSVLAQTIRDIEIIVSDDASPDDSAAVVRDYAQRDPRVRLIEASANGGPAAARNKALRAARGEWIAIVDSDDVIEPERFAILLAETERLQGDAVADDLLFFSENGEGPALLGGHASEGPFPVSPEFFIRSNITGNGLPPLGYLKPMYRRSSIAGLLYDENMRIAEDYDFLLRFLLDGRSLFILPQPLYRYRRHPASISHRLSEAHVLAMIANQQALLADRSGQLPCAVLDALDLRMKSLRRQLAFERLVAAMKGRRPARALGMLATQPHLIAPLARSASEHWRARLGKPARFAGVADAG
jgi:succinoglycan biosynthesis protein ExoO